MCELSLLWACASVASLDTLLVLPPSDTEGIRICRALQDISGRFSVVHERQTSNPHIIVRVADPEREADFVREARDAPAFTLTPMVARAALPNLMAEIVHPEAHWSHSLDNAL